MINVIAPPGCYGTYVARCLHQYTSVNNDYRLDFDQNGSSHAFRKIDDSVKKTTVFHCPVSTDQTLDDRSTVVITGHHDHYLDYYDNQLYKHSHGNVVDYLIAVIGLEKIQLQLNQGWNYQGSFDATTPNWIIREHCSFWIADTLAQMYSSSLYLSVPHVYSFCCQDMWTLDIWQLLNKSVTALAQQIYAPEHVVQQNHQAFLQCQQHHGIQLKCDQFVLDTINLIDTKSPCVSIFDEAYVQYALRKQGYEIQCYNLEQFPTSSKQLAKIIYETSNNNH